MNYKNRTLDKAIRTCDVKQFNVDWPMIIRKSDESSFKSFLSRYGLKLVNPSKQVTDRAEKWHKIDESKYKIMTVKGKMPESDFYNDQRFNDGIAKYMAGELW